MPPFAGFQTAAVVVPSSLHRSHRYDPPRRVYPKHDLPIHTSTAAPRNARIVNRVLDQGIPTFGLRIGNTDVPGVGLDEILEYVSAYELEEYENAQFTVEGEMLRLADEEDERIENERYARQRERARNKGVVLQQTESEGEGMVVGEVELGKHGRARPSYKQLFKQVRQRKQRRKRDPITRELVDLSDKDEAMGMERASSSDTRVAGPSSVANVVGEQKKRRRRRRDPVTGELLPLPPLQAGQTEASEESSSDEENIDNARSKPMGLASLSLGEKPKRPRRRRHPITSELMPLGWIYDPTKPEEIAITSSSAVTAPPGLHRFSISQEHEPKRRRLDDSPAGRTRSRSPIIVLPASQSSSRASPPPRKLDKGKGRERDMAPLDAFSGGVIDLASSDNDKNASSDEQAKELFLKPKPKVLRRSMGGTTITQPSRRSTGSSSTPESRAPSIRQSGNPKPTSPAKATRAQTLSRSQSSTSDLLPLALSPEPSTQLSQPLTSITHPNPPPASGSEGESDEDEYPIEAILAHHLSDPRSHPPELGGKAVMLYQVKWEGWEELTWEPVSSFGDTGEPGGGVVGEYRRRVGLD